MTKEQKEECAECGKEIIPKIEGIDLCKGCDAKNWITDPAEMAKALKSDPSLRKQQILHEIREIIFQNCRKGTMCDDIEDGQVLGLRTGKGLEFENVSLCLADYLEEETSKAYSQGKEDGIAEGEVSERKFILNMLDGHDRAHKEAGISSHTRMIRMMLSHRHVGKLPDNKPESL